MASIKGKLKKETEGLCFVFIWKRRVARPVEPEVPEGEKQLGQAYTSADWMNTYHVQQAETEPNNTKPYDGYQEIAQELEPILQQPRPIIS